MLLESTGVIGRQLKMEALLRGVPQLAGSLGASADAAQHAAVAITTTDLVSKSAALEASLQVTVSYPAVLGWTPAGHMDPACGVLCRC